MSDARSFLTPVSFVTVEKIITLVTNMNRDELQGDSNVLAGTGARWCVLHAVQHE